MLLVLFLRLWYLFYSNINDLILTLMEYNIMKTLKKIAAVTLVSLAMVSSANAGHSIYNTGYSPVFQEAFSAD